ncbi:hypothetical protein KIW84_040198 [Lathyrus oleraceus]|uniref:Uncharacterized protein n=3 Tax=Pisum sativum TaxID=3888 RepID=A0A9D5AMN4_PEA|nr:hypothetical protein KIW84_040198 [Pisum sativum]
MSSPTFITLEEGCDYLQKGITKLLNILEGFPEPNFTPEHHILLYTTVYNMCYQRAPQDYARKLYDMYKETCAEYIISKVLPFMREKKDDLLLRELLRRWSNYIAMTKRLSKFFCPLEKRDIPRLKVPSLEETSFLSFYHLVYEEMNKEIMDAVFAMVDRERAGEHVDQTFALNTLDLYLELKECTRKIKEKEEKMNCSPDVLSKKINLVSSDGIVFEVDFGLALMSKRFEETIETIPVGDVDTISVHEVSSKMLRKVVEYCKKHNIRQKYVNNLEDWEAKFIDVDTKTLLDLQTYASYLKIDSLQMLAWDKEYGLIKGMTREEMTEFYAAQDDSNSMVRRRGADGRIPVRTLDRGASSSAAAAEPTGYPGGPYDTSLLVKYEHHVARHIWFGEERGPKKESKVAGHGLKLNSRVPLALPPQMESWVSRSGLASLQRTSLNKIDTNLVSAFVERWHLETSSFHMPFGEMSITLDDVACLLHLPIRGIFWSPQDVTEELAVELAVDYLGVSQGQAQSHVRSCRGSYYKLEWLYDIFVHHRAASSWAYATRAYLLMLVGSTIFADKTFTLVEARYLLLFRGLDGCSGYSWGAAALVTLYRYLGDASMYSCKQLGGYPTLLQCWIHEYFPTVGKEGRIGILLETVVFPER